MRAILFKLLLFQIIILSYSTAYTQQLYFNTEEYDIGDIWSGDDISFEFWVYYNLSSPHDYVIKIEDVIEDQPWINSISPTYFYFGYYGEAAKVEVQGYIDPGVLTLGIHNFPIHFYDAENYQTTIVATFWVQYNYLGSLGIEDYILITNGVNAFFEGDMISYEAHFYDEDPFGDEIDEWNLEIKLFSTEGEYTYVDLTNMWGATSTYWNFIAPNIPQNLTFTRNEQGQIHGILTVTGHDTDGYDHTVDLIIGINKEPDPPELHAIPQENNTVKIILTNSGGTNNLLYYDTDSGEPYNGTGLTQGNSPISMGSTTIIDLEGFQECSKYYFAAKATNQYGTSDYSDEIALKIFSSSNGLPIYYHLSDCYIPEGYELEGNHYFTGNLIIESGVTLTIEGGIMYFEENSKIIIEPGGKLILDGTTCTSPCGNTWQGIEVWGYADQHQFEYEGYPCAQGQLILNGATIENAVSAVELWKPGYNNTTGGIVQATDAIFRNNAKSVHALNYSNFHPWTGMEMDNVSYFNNCTFELNGDYIPTQTFNKHVDLADVKGIKFKGCDFTVADVPGVSQWNKGIAAYSAGFRIDAICTEPIMPTCPEEYLDKCHFSGFNNAIYVINSSSVYSIYVGNAEFNDNSYGISLSIVNNATILFNNFYLGGAGDDQIEECGNRASSYGIYMDNCTGFAIEENYFTKAQGAPLGNYIGIMVTDCPSESDVIYLNEFNGLSVGIQAEGENRSDPNNYFTGVTYLCNQNANNNYDYYVADISIVGGYMGGYDNPSGNTLSPNAQVQFQNDYTDAIHYFYNQNEPDEVLSLFSYYVFPVAINYENTCPSHYGGGVSVVLTPEQRQQTEQDFATYLTDYNNVKALFDNLIDGGNTEALQSEVEMSWPNDMWELRDELLGKSPHLSKEVLMAVADKTDVLPESVIFEILSANPDELRKEELMSYLENKEQPLPQYMIDILRQLANGISYKTVLLSEMSSYHAKKVSADQDIVRSILNEEELDVEELRNWLDNIGGMEADKQIIETYMMEGDYNSAQSLLDMLPALYELSGDELQKYNDYKSLKQLLMNLSQQDRTIFDLDETELATIVNLAEYGNGSAKTSAQGILEFAYGYNYCNCPVLPENIQLKSSTIDMENLAKAKGLEISAEPNPAGTWSAFDYTLPLSETEGIIEITDNSGRTLQHIIVTQQKGQYVLDTRNYKSGIYYYTLSSGNLQRTGKLIVK